MKDLFQNDCADEEELVFFFRP